MPRWLSVWWCTCAAYVVTMSLLDLKASVEIDRLCMQGGLLSGVWKNKHCNNAARDLENGPFALMDLVAARVVNWRFVVMVAGTSVVVSMLQRAKQRGLRWRRDDAPLEPPPMLPMLMDADADADADSSITNTTPTPSYLDRLRFRRSTLAPLP